MATCENEKIDGAAPCTEAATQSFTWPGKPKSALCTKHMEALCKVAIPAQLGIEPIGDAKPVELPPFKPDGRKADAT